MLKIKIMTSLSPKRVQWSLTRGARGDRLVVNSLGFLLR
jgi:hypothetical protein